MSLACNYCCQQFPAKLKYQDRISLQKYVSPMSFWATFPYMGVAVVISFVRTLETEIPLGGNFTSPGGYERV